MSFYGEPKNGDFASYVEELSRRGASASATPSINSSAPGEVHKAKKARPPKPASAQSSQPRVATLDPQSRSLPESAAPTTLAGQARERQRSSRDSLIGFVFICFTMWELASYVAGEHQAPARFVLPGLIGFWLFRRAARARARSRAVPGAASLPPLIIRPKP